MKVVKLVKLGAELLKLMSICDLKVEDYKYVDLYADYVKARQNGEKYIVTIMDLAQRYGVSESTVKRIIRRFDKDV